MRSVMSCGQGVVIFLVYLLLFGCPYGYAQQEEALPPEVLARQRTAADLHKAGDLAGALAEYDQIIRIYPDTSYAFDAHAQIARIYVKEKRFDQLEPLVAQMLPAFNEHHGIFRLLSDLVKDCMYAKAYPEAIAVCREADTRLSNHPRRTLITGWRGMIFAHEGNFTMAEEMIRALHEQGGIASDYLDAMKDIGWGYYCAGRLDEALVLYRQGLTRYADHPSAVYLQYHVVQACLSKGDPEASGREMDTLLSQYGHRPSTPALACRLANEYRRKGYVQQALGIYQSLIERFPEHSDVPGVWDSIVETYADIGDLDKAVEALNINIEHYPHRRELARMIARVAVETARRSDTDTAMKLVSDIFDQAFQGPDQLFGYTTLARVYVHQGRDVEAEATVNEALGRFKDYPGDLSYHLFGVGEEYVHRAQRAFEAGDAAAAAFGFRKAVEFWQKPVISSNPKIPRMLAICYQQLEQPELSTAFYNKMQLMNPAAGRGETITLPLAGDRYCGAYAVWHLLKHYGKSVSVDEIADQMGIPRKGYATINDIVNLLKRYEVAAQPLRIQTNKADQINTPFIQYLIPRSDQTLGHFVLCLPTGTGRAVVLDGVKAPYVIDLTQYQQSEAFWDGTLILIQQTREDYLSETISRQLMWQTAVAAGQCWIGNELTDCFQRANVYYQQGIEQKVELLRGGCSDLDCLTTGAKCNTEITCTSYNDCQNQIANYVCRDYTKDEQCLPTNWGWRPCTVDPDHICSPRKRILASCINKMCEIIPSGEYGPCTDSTTTPPTQRTMKQCHDGN